MNVCFPPRVFYGILYIQRPFHMPDYQNKDFPYFLMILVVMCLFPLNYMSHFSYACKMRCPLNLVLESWEYLWFYLIFWIAILDCGLKLHKLSIHTLVMLQK